MDFLRDIAQSFIPRAENDYKPYFFRTRSVLSMLAIILFLGVVALGMQTLIIKNTSYLAAVISSVLVNLANGDRTQNGLEGLAVSPVLTEAAQFKADDMAKNSYFAHTSPDGVTPWFWFKEAGYEFSYAGENLAVRFSDSIDVNVAWMSSPSHRANILNSEFSEIGVATAQGTYEGQQVVFVVQEFGRPAAVPQPLPVLVAAPAGTTTPKTPAVAGTSTPLKKPAPPAKAVTIATTSPAEVAGTSTEGVSPKVILENDTFIAVKNVPAANSPAAVAAASGGWVAFFEKLFTSPKTLMNVIYLIFAALITVALVFMVFFEVKRQHPLNILYGVGLLVLIVALLYLGEVYISGPLTIL